MEMGWRKCVASQEDGIIRSLTVFVCEGGWVAVGGVEGGCVIHDCWSTLKRCLKTGDQTDVMETQSSSLTSHTLDLFQH